MANVCSKLSGFNLLTIIENEKGIENELMMGYNFLFMVSLLQCRVD